MLNRLLSRDFLLKAVNLGYFGAAFLNFGMWTLQAFSVSVPMTIIFGSLTLGYAGLLIASIMDACGRWRIEAAEAKLISGGLGKQFRNAALFLPAPFLIASAWHSHLLSADSFDASDFARFQYSVVFGAEAAETRFRSEERRYYAEASDREKRGDLQGAFISYANAASAHPCAESFAAAGACLDKLGDVKAADMSYDIAESKAAEALAHSPFQGNAEGQKVLCDARLIPLRENDRSKTCLMWSTFTAVSPNQFNRIQSLRHSTPPAVHF